MTRKELQQWTRKQLAALARQQQVPGWSRLRKEELIAALAPRLRGVQLAPPALLSRAQHTVAQEVRSSAEEEVESSKYQLVGVPTRHLSPRAPKELPAGYGKDRVVLLVRDPYWLHAYWEITPAARQRAEAALGQDWHQSRLILRLLDVTSPDVSSATERLVRDIELREEANNWYIEVPEPPRSFRVDLGYRTPSGQFFVLARSNVASTPRASMSEVVEDDWETVAPRQSERLLAMSAGYQPGASSLEMKQLFEERLRRPLASPAVSSVGSGAWLRPPRPRQFWFQLDAELIVYGATEPTARVTLQGEPVRLRPDGTFTVRFALPDGRQIIPAVAVSADGLEERTIVLAVERNTRHLEPVRHSTEEED
jgi:hypothetical protein